MVVVLPIFIVLFAGMLFLHEAVAKTQRSMLAARREAWKAAMEGCSGGEEVPQPDRTSDMNGAPGAEVSTKATIGFSTGTAEDQAKVAILSAGAVPVAESGGLHFEADIHSRVVVMCNTQPQPGDIPGVLKWFWNSPGRQAIWNAILHH
jgi:hypothetical protein